MTVEIVRNERTSDDVWWVTEKVTEPLAVEVEEGWVHVVEYEQFGSRRVLRSLPAHTVREVRR